MKIILCAVQPHLATAWRERIGADLSNCVRVVEGDILSLDVMAVVSPANGYGYMDGGLDALYTRFFGPLGIVETFQRAYQVAGDPPHALKGNALSARLGGRYVMIHSAS